MRQKLARYHDWLLFALTLAGALAGGWAISLAVPLPAAHEFNVIDWELRSLPNKWLYLTGRFFEGRLSPAEEDERLGRYLALTARIEQLERTADDNDEAPNEELGRLRRERDRLENDAEAIIEGRLTAVLEEAGLESSLPLFPAARWVFPPVDVEFDQPPRVVAISRRDRIELVEQRPLRPGLPRDEAIAVERAVERDERRSALVLSLAGAATYPSIVGPRGEYELLVDTVAHEWVHHYLAFKPLGLRFYNSLELRTLNETVANLAGRELAALVVQRYPLPLAVASQVRPSPAAPDADVDHALRQLRLDVEALLGEGQIEDAEALMERRRQELADQGVVFRRINQAFFAFRSVYADDPVSLSPLGGKVEGLRQQAGSVGAFLRAAAGLTSGGDLDRRLAGAR